MRPHADTFDKTLFQFCYIDGTDCVQGMSCSFHLVAASPISHSSVPSESAAAVASCHSEPIDGDENDFVEIEDEDGEIVIIKSRTAFLQDELKKLESAAKVDSHITLSQYTYIKTCYVMLCYVCRFLNFIVLGVIGWTTGRASVPIWSTKNLTLLSLKIFGGNILLLSLVYLIVCYYY